MTLARVAGVALFVLVTALSLRTPDPTSRKAGTNADPAEILALRGDFERGRGLVFESTLQCRACHRFGTGEEKLGPDLGEIGKKYDRAKLLETLLDASKEVDPKYATLLVETTSGAVHSGILVETTADRIVLQDPEKTIPIPLASVKRRVTQQKSIMPDSLLQGLTAQESADLLEFLWGLK